MNLFSPLTLRGISLRNRIGVSPMCQYSCQDGFATDWHLVHLGSRAVGGAGIVIAEASAVSPEGRITPGDLGIWKDEHIENLARIAKFVASQGAAPAIQIAHAGRKASCDTPWNGGRALGPEAGGWQTVAPSPVPFQTGDPVPHELSIEEIAQVVQQFAAAARRAVAAGFHVLEIHAAHGYLLHEFYSPLSNRREDKYGGTFENRTRIVREVARSVRAEWPDELPLWVRVSSTDWTKDGWNGDDTVALARMLKEDGVDLLDCSSGANVPGVRIQLSPGYQVQFASRVRREAGMATAAVGLITSATQANAIIERGEADMVLLAREFLRDPYFPQRAAKELGAPVPVPVQYLRAHN